MTRYLLEVRIRHILRKGPGGALTRYECFDINGLTSRTLGNVCERDSSVVFTRFDINYLGVSIGDSTVASLLEVLMKVLSRHDAPK